MTISRALNSLETAPSFLGKERVTRGFYKEILHYAELNNKATEADKLAAGLIAEQFYLYSCAKDALYDENGNIQLVIEQIGDKGQSRLVPNPAVKMFNDASDRVMKGLREFGLTPRSRSEVEALDNKTESELLKFLKGD